MRERWSLFAFGVLGAGNTCLFRDSASTSDSSMRLFFERFCIALKQALTDDKTGISVCVIAHLARLAQHQRSTWSVPLNRLTGIVAHDQAMAAVTRSGCVGRVDAGGYNLVLPRLILGIAEDAAFHPVGALGVTTARVLPLFGLEIAQMLKDEHACTVLFGELDNASAHQMRHVLIGMADLTPEADIVLFILCNDASLRSVACYPPKQFRALCPLSLYHLR